MSQSDTHPQRTRARVAIERLGGRADVIDVDLIPAGKGIHEAATVEIAIEAAAVSPAVSQELGDAGLWVRETRPRMGEWMTVIAVAEEP